MDAQRRSSIGLVPEAVHASGQSNAASFVQRIMQYRMVVGPRLRDDEKCGEPRSASRPDLIGRGSFIAHRDYLVQQSHHVLVDRHTHCEFSIAIAAMVHDEDFSSRFLRCIRVHMLYIRDSMTHTMLLPEMLRTP